MTVSFISTAHTNSGATSAAASLSVTIPNDGSVHVGDIMIAFASCERNALPILTLSSGSLSAITLPAPGTNVAAAAGSLTVGSGDLGATVTVTFTGSVTRYSSMTLLFVRGAASFASQAGSVTINNASTYSLIFPSITPTADNCLLVGVAARVVVASPYVSAVTPASGWTEQLEEGSSRSAGNNGLLYVMSKALGASTSGVATGTASATEAAASSQYIPLTLSFVPAAASAPTMVLALSTVWDMLDASSSAANGSDTSLTISASPTSNPDGVAHRTDGAGRVFVKRGSTEQTYTVTATGSPSGLTATATQAVKALIPAVEVVSWNGTAWV